ncbi:MAG: hypothetical protein ACO27B_04380 [Ilumatobacteraceae bacterium]
MSNLFDAANAPSAVPEKIVVGDFIQWKRTDLSSDYPPASYTATYIARITGGGASEIQVTGTNSDGIYLFTVTSATSAGFNAGQYHWQLEIVQNSSGNRIVVDRGYFEAIVDLDANNADPRTHAEIMITKIESLLSGKADSDVANYSIAGRSLTKLTFQELIQARDYYKQEHRKEEIDERIRRGIATGSTIQVRF